MIRPLAVLGAAAALAGFAFLPGSRIVVPALAAAPDFASVAVQPYDPPKPAPPLALPDLGGRMVRLEDFRGKVVVLFFWTTW
ncbi:MAG: redoxin domain-containing protein [Candidatus Rokubacteria bacterium]|nr:redoxin domain-containing protein [Candidatus Rokubacteria bacterium]